MRIGPFPSRKSRFHLTHDTIHLFIIPVLSKGPKQTSVCALSKLRAGVSIVHKAGDKMATAPGDRQGARRQKTHGVPPYKSFRSKKKNCSNRKVYIKTYAEVIWIIVCNYFLLPYFTCSKLKKKKKTFRLSKLFQEEARKIHVQDWVQGRTLLLTGSMVAAVEIRGRPWARGRPRKNKTGDNSQLPLTSPLMEFHMIRG